MKPEQYKKFHVFLNSLKIGIILIQYYKPCESREILEKFFIGTNMKKEINVTPQTVIFYVIFAMSS